MAGAARNIGEVFGQLLARPFALGLAEAAFQVGDHAFERLLGLVGAQAVVIDEADHVFARAVEDRVLHFLWQVLPFGLEGEFVELRQRFQGLGVIRRGRTRPRSDRAPAQRGALVRNDEVGVDMLLHAEAAAGRAGAERIVEGEQPRFDLGNREAGYRAGEFFRERDALGLSSGGRRELGFLGGPLLHPSPNRSRLLPTSVTLLNGRTLAIARFGWGGVGGGGRGVWHRDAITPRPPTPTLPHKGGGRRVGELHHRNAVGKLERLLETFSKPLGDVRAHHNAVHHHVDVVVEFLVERRRGRDLVEGAVDLDSLIALFEVFGEFLAVFALAAAHHRGEEIEPRSFRQRQHAVNHLRDGLALDRQAGGGRISDADARPQQAHVVVDLRDGADRGARVFRGGLLLDGDRRRQPVDLVDVRLLHHLQELARIGRKAFHVAPLAFRIDGVEGERGLAGARQPGEYHEPVARDLKIDVLEIVLAGAADRYHTAAVEIAARTVVEQIGHATFPASASASPARGGGSRWGLLQRVRAVELSPSLTLPRKRGRGLPMAKRGRG